MNKQKHFSTADEYAGDFVTEYRHRWAAAKSCEEKWAAVNYMGELVERGMVHAEAAIGGQPQTDKEWALLDELNSQRRIVADIRSKLRSRCVITKDYRP